MGSLFASCRRLNLKLQKDIMVSVSSLLKCMHVQMWTNDRNISYQELSRTLLQVGFPARARWLHCFAVWKTRPRTGVDHVQIFKSCCLLSETLALFLVRTAFFTTWKIQKLVRHQGIWRPLPAGWCSKDPAPMPQKMAMLSNISNVYQTGP